MLSYRGLVVTEITSTEEHLQPVHLRDGETFISELSAQSKLEGGALSHPSKRCALVLELGTLLLRLAYCARGPVHDAHRSVPFVAVLPTLAAAAFALHVAVSQGH